jgi:hypothetical protein
VQNKHPQAGLTGLVIDDKNSFGTITYTLFLKRPYGYKVVNGLGVERKMKVVWEVSRTASLTPWEVINAMMEYVSFDLERGEIDNTVIKEET